MDHVTAMRVFRRVVELESFVGAARDLGLSKAAVSKNVAGLEAHLGVRLLERTTRRMRTTEAGLAYYQRCLRILAEIEEADLEAAQQSRVPKGLLRVSAPMSFGLLHLAPIIAGFLERYPEIEVDLDMNDRAVNLVEEGYDIAIRGGGTFADSSLVAQRIIPVGRVLCASPRYLAARGVPAVPQDLQAHACLVYSLSSSPRNWRLIGPEQSVSIAIKGPYSVNNSIALREAALAGAGIALLPAFVIGTELEDGRLVRLLEDWQPEEQALYALFPQRRYLAPKIRCFIEYLMERLRPVR